MWKKAYLTDEGMWGPVLRETVRKYLLFGSKQFSPKRQNFF